MIITKRQIRRDTDRFGGYGTELRTLADFDDISNTEPPVPTMENVGSGRLMSDVNFNISNSTQVQEQPQLYTTLVSAPAQEQHVELPARPQKAEQPRNKEDVLPTLKTRAYADDKTSLEQKEAVAPAKRARHALDSRTKILLCVYVAIALVLAIAVIATGVSISSASAQADAIMSRISQKQAMIAEQEVELASLRNDETIREHALQNGMVPVGTATYSAPAAVTYEYPTATPHTNGFDEFCDWLYNIIG